MSSNADEPVFVDPRREHQRIAERLTEFGTATLQEVKSGDDFLIKTFGPLIPPETPACYGSFGQLSRRERGCHHCSFFDRCLSWTLANQPPKEFNSNGIHRHGDNPESDPNGIPQHAPGAKLDAGKTRLWLVFSGFANALEEVGKVVTFGAKKYSDDGWRSVPDGVPRYSDALLRHLLAEAAGEALDADSGLTHAAHAAWNALARLELLLAERGKLE